MEFHSQVLPLSVENAWLQIGSCGLRTSQRNTTMIGWPLKVSRAKKWPILFSNEPTTGGSRWPELLSAQ